MTRATWNRIERLSIASVSAQDSFNQQREANINACIYRLLKRAGIDMDIPEWDMISTNYDDATIEVYNDKGKLIKTFSVLEDNLQAA